MKSNPLTDGSLDGYRVIKANITELTINAVKETGLKGNEAPREEQPVKVAVTEEWRQSELVKRASALSAPHALRHEAVLSRTVKRLYSKPGPSKGAAAI